MRLAILLSLLLGTQAADAQWGIRFLTPHGENVTKLGLFRQLSIGVGVDHNVSGRTLIGFDYVWSLGDLFSTENSDITNWNGYQITYSEYVSYSGIQYHSIFFLNDDLYGPYIGTTIGYRRVVQGFNSFSAFDTSTGNFVPESTFGVNTQREEPFSVFPIGLRLGTRGDIEDGFFGDLYVGIGYQLGGNKAIGNYPFLDEESELSGLVFQIGCAWGFGW